ncbi:pirin family protein [Verrucomicrobiaceae bacterium N1E253]|uniref:Pirin family protein n=2 Tax=Oceaniferula marina TaxID=2748318 RepID=A0A851GIR2_9BACT|nr:pirin family protein [Oceaniferula marina]
MTSSTQRTPEKIPLPDSIRIRRSDDRGHINHGWLDARHSFSFGNYYDPDHMGFGSLRVINDDRIAPGKGFDMHPHSAMEIFTYIISGELEHRDSMGNGRIIKAGEFQYMSAGDGVMHSESNPSTEQSVHLLQIWITPNQSGGPPLYADMDTNALKKKNSLSLFASRDGRNGSQTMRQNAEIFFGHLESGAKPFVPPQSPFDQHYLHLIKGQLDLAGHTLHQGDAAMIHGATPGIVANEDAEFLYFNLSSTNQPQK